MITANEVRTAQFRRAEAGKVGYDEVGVDDYLDRVADTLDAIERGGQMPPHAVSAHDVVEVVFSERGPQAAGGYDLDDVDDLLDRVAQRIHSYEDGVRRASAPVEGGLPSDAPQGGDVRDARDERGFAADERDTRAEQPGALDGDRRDGHDGRGVAAAGAAGAAGVAGAAAYDRRDDRGDARDGMRDDVARGDARGDLRDERYDERGFADERDLRDERQTYADPAAPEFDDTPRRGFADDGGVRDGEALAVAGGAPARDERFDDGRYDNDRYDERGFEPTDQRSGAFGEPGVRVDERSDAAAFDGRRDGNVSDDRFTEDRGFADERRDERGFDGRDAGLAAGGSAVAAGGAAAAYDQRDERRDEGFAPDGRADMRGGLRDERTVDTTRHTDGADAGRQGGINMVGADPVDEAPIMAPDETGTNRELRADDRSDANASDGAARAASADRGAFANGSEVTPEERFDAERRDDVVRDERVNGEQFNDPQFDGRNADLRDERGFAPEGDGVRDDARAGQFGNEPFGDERGDAGLRDERGFAAGQDNAVRDDVRGEQFGNQPLRNEDGFGDERGFETERDERSSGFGPAGVAAAAGGAAAGGYAAHRHSEAGEQVERTEWAPRDERDTVRIDGEPVDGAAGDPVCREHDAADYHDPAAAHSETFDEPVPPQQVNAGEARPVAAAEQGDNWAFEDNGLRNDRARMYPDEGAIILNKDADSRTDERFEDTNAYEGDAVAGGDAVADERPIAAQPEIVSYRATDRRVPLPRSEARRSMSDEDREAEAQYHPEYSAYSSPEGDAVAADAPRQSMGGAYGENSRTSSSRDADRGPDAGVLPNEQAPFVEDRPVAPEAPVAPAGRREGEFDPFSEPSPVAEQPLPTEPTDRTQAPQAAPGQTGGFERDPFADDARRDGSFDVAGGGDDVRESQSFERRDSFDAGAPVAPAPGQRGGFERDPFADDARRDGSFDVAGGGDDVRNAQSFERPEQPAQAEPFGGRGTDGPQRVAPMNEETAGVREPREGGFEQPGVGNRDPFADDARRDGSFDVAGGGDDVRDQQSFEAPSPVAEDRRASDVERPESIDRPQPIDKAEPLPERDDTSRKGLLRRIFKG